jgi:TolB-like protein/Tfp pilus assembly protein PilF
MPSLAVLPFANLSADKENEYFSDGLAEEIINALSQIPGRKVIARTSAFAFKGKHEDVRRIAESLGVANVLEGSVRKSGNRIRITAQLITAADGSHLWSERYDRELRDVFAIQDELSQAIAEKLRVRLAGGRPLVKRSTENVEACNFYLKGRYQANKWTPEALAKSKEYFEQSIAVDPNFALAWFGLAYLYFILGYHGYMPPRPTYAQANQAVLKALELDEMLPEAHAGLGSLRAIDFDWKGAERAFLRTLELDAQSVDVWTGYDFGYLVPMRRLDEAIVGMRKALERDPVSPLLHFRLGLWYYYTRQYDRSMEQARNALELDPNYYAPYILIAGFYEATGKPEEFIQAWETLAQLAGHSHFALGYLGYSYASVGRIGDARKLLEKLQELEQKAFVPPSSFAHIYFGLGEIDKAFDWFEKAVEVRDAWICHIGIHPRYDPLRSHPRFHALLRKMNLE